MSKPKTPLRPAQRATARQGWLWRALAGSTLAGLGAFGLVRGKAAAPEMHRAAPPEPLPAAPPRVRSEADSFRPVLLPLAPPVESASVSASVARAEAAPAPSASDAVPLLPERSPLEVAPSASAPSVNAPRSKPHRVPFAALAAWSKPGLCTDSADAVAVRDTMTESFRAWEPDDGGKFYLDPRLAPDAQLPIAVALRHAEAEVSRLLGLRPARPLVFVYADQPLLKAAACINENAVAFYDGALHVVANRADVRDSVLHEYTHHALFSSGFVTPAWAQEGIAMTVAGERWWRAPQYLQALTVAPFSLEQMDRSIAYKLPSAQALAFYVQSAALVECLTSARHWSLFDLLTALRSGASADALAYDLPELEQRDFLQRCLGVD